MQISFQLVAVLTAALAVAAVPLPRHQERSLQGAPLEKRMFSWSYFSGGN